MNETTGDDGLCDPRTVDVARSGLLNAIARTKSPWNSEMATVA